MKTQKAPILTPFLADVKAGTLAPAWLRWLHDLSTAWFTANTPAPCTTADRAPVGDTAFVLVGNLCTIQAKPAATVEILLPQPPMIAVEYWDGTAWIAVAAGAKTLSLVGGKAVTITYIYRNEGN